MSAEDDKPIHAEFYWGEGEGSPELRAEIEAFYRSPEGQRRLREQRERSARYLVRPTAATKDVKET